MPTMSDSSHAWDQELAFILLLLLAGLAFLQPGVLLGAFLLVLWSRWRRPTQWLALSATAIATAAALTATLPMEFIGCKHNRTGVRRCKSLVSGGSVQSNWRG